jgi:anaphase-promoting complex subunit 8
MSTKIEVRRQLRLAVRNLDAHGLQLSSKWASEQLVGMDLDNDTDEISFNENTSNIPPQEYDLLLFAKNLLNNGEYQRCAHLLRRKPIRKDCNGDSKKGTTSSIPASASEKGVVSSTLGLFLSAYSMYMAGEKLNEQQQTSDNINSGNLFPGMIGSTATTDKQSSSEGQNKVKPKINEKALGYDREYKKNPFLNELFIELDLLYKEEKMDGFLLYLFAIVVRDLVKQGQVQGQGGPHGLSICNPSDSAASGGVQGKNEGLSAYSLFIKSLKNYPWNWSCWLELSELCATEKLSPPTWQQVDPMSLVSSSKPQIPSSSSSSYKEMKSNGQEGRVMYLCFLAHYYLELQQGEKAMKILEGVLHVFPNSQLVTSQVALSYYCMRDYEKAQNVFEQARENDPHKIEHLDAYSNILYVREKRAELSFLAHRYVFHVFAHIYIYMYI